MMAMYFETSGKENAPAIVFIHGGGISGWMWKRQAAAFSDYNCIVPDLPEHGRSMAEGPITLSDCADRIAELIKSRAVNRKAHVIGHSIGGKIIVELLSRHPDVVDRAVIVSALYRPIPFLKWFFNRAVYRCTVAMLKNEALLAYQVKQFGFPDEADRRNLMNDFRSLTVDNLERVYGELYRHLSLPEHLDAAFAPSLVISGAKEPRAMRESVNDIAKALPYAKGILFDGCGHDIPWKAGDAFNKTVREWLTGEPLTSPAVLPAEPGGRSRTAK